MLIIEPIWRVRFEDPAELLTKRIVLTVPHQSLDEFLHVLTFNRLQFEVRRQDETTEFQPDPTTA